MASKSATQLPATKTVFARVAPELHEKLMRMAASASAKTGVRVTMQEMLAELVEKAKER